MSVIITWILVFLLSSVCHILHWLEGWKCFLLILGFRYVALVNLLKHSNVLAFHLLNAFPDQNDSSEWYLLQRPRLLFSYVIELCFKRFKCFQTSYDLLISNTWEHSKLHIYFLSCPRQKRLHLVYDDLSFGLEVMKCLKISFFDEALLCSYAVLNKSLNFFFLVLFIFFIALRCIWVGSVEVESIINEQCIDLFFYLFGEDWVCNWIQLTVFLLTIMLLSIFQGLNQALL